MKRINLAKQFIMKKYRSGVKEKNAPAGMGDYTGMKLTVVQDKNKSEMIKSK